MRTLLPALAAVLFTTLLIQGLSPSASAQDSRPKDGKQKPARAKGDEKKDESKNPLDDPEWQRKAKLGKLVAKKRCVICHKIDGKGGVLSPPMEEVTPKRFEAMKSYESYVKTLKGTDPARYRASKDKIDAIVNEKDRYKQIILWLQSYMKKPTFDNGKAKMTPQSLKPVEIEQVIAYLLTLEKKAADEKK